MEPFILHIHNNKNTISKKRHQMMPFNLLMIISNRFFRYIQVN